MSSKNHSASLSAVTVVILLSIFSTTARAQNGVVGMKPHGGPADAARGQLSCLGRGVNVAGKATGGNGTPGAPYTGWDAFVTSASNTTYCFADGATFSYSTPLVILNTKDTRLVGAGPGTSVLKFNGAGKAVTFRSTSNETYTGNGVENLEIVGTARATDGLYMESQHHGIIRNVRVREVAEKGLHWKFGIVNLIENFRVSVNEYAMTVRPQNGIYVEARGAGETFQGNVIINPIIEGTAGDGIVFKDAWQNTQIGGTSEGNHGGGKTFDANSNGNTDIGTDYEANRGTDVVIAGRGNVLAGVLSLGTVNIAGGQGNVIRDGQMREIVIGAGASQTVLDNASFGLNGGGGIFDNSATTIQLSPSRNLNNGSTGVIIKTPTLLGAWGNYGAPFEAAGYYRGGIEVKFRGTVKGGADGSTIFTLPVGVRPTTSRSFVVPAGKGMGRVTVRADGAVVINLFAGGDTSAVNLDGVEFDVQ